jgi:hypothetical protein
MLYDNLYKSGLYSYTSSLHIFFFFQLSKFNKGRSPFNGTVRCPIFPPFYIDSQISVHRKLKKIDQLIFRNVKEIYFNEKFPIL